MQKFKSFSEEDVMSASDSLQLNMQFAYDQPLYLEGWAMFKYDEASSMSGFLSFRDRNQLVQGLVNGMPFRFESEGYGLSNEQRESERQQLYNLISQENPDYSKMQSICAKWAAPDPIHLFCPTKRLLTDAGDIIEAIRGFYGKAHEKININDEKSIERFLDFLSGTLDDTLGDYLRNEYELEV